MDLLLLLSAFLTALTGAITSVRPVQAVRQEQVIAPVRQARVAVRVPAARPVQGWPALPRLLSAAGDAFALGLAIPVFGQRRRE